MPRERAHGATQHRRRVLIVSGVWRRSGFSYHLYYGPGAVGILIWASVFVWLFLRTRSLIPLIAVHCLWDLAATFSEHWSAVGAFGCSPCLASSSPRPSPGWWSGRGPIPQPACLRPVGIGTPGAGAGGAGGMGPVGRQPSPTALGRWQGLLLAYSALRASGLATPAQAHDGEVPRVDSEAVGGDQLFGEGSEGLLGDLDHLAATFTQQVLVAVFGQMVGGGAVAKMDVLDHPELFEGGQVAIDGRFGHVWMLEFDLGHDVLGAQVGLAGVEQDADGGSAGVSGPAAAVSNLADDRFHPIRHGHAPESIAEPVEG